MASNAKALSFLSGDLSLSGTEVSINVAGSVQSDSITGSTITMKNTGSTIVASDGTTAVLSESGGTVTLTADTAVIEGSSSGDLVRITQTGSGNALVVEDSANPDSTPFVVDASGKVGIGTNSPYDPLSVHGTGTAYGSGYIVARVMDSSGNKGVFLGYDADENGGTIGGANFLTFQTYDSGWDERMRIDNNGKVGIGTNSPSSYYANHLVVDIGSSVQSGITIVSDTGNQGMFAFADGTSGNARYRGAIDYNHSNDSMAFLAAGAEAMRIDSSGNVAIGISSANEKLRVVGTSGTPQFGAGTASNTLYINAFDSNPIYMTASVSNSTSFGFGSASNIPLFFMTNNTERMRIDTSGNIGAPSGTNIYNASDQRLKQNITDLSGCLQKVLLMRGVSFNWIDEFCESEADKTLYGLIAQELQTVDVNLVDSFSDNTITAGEVTVENPLRVNEKFIIPMLVESIKEQQTLIESQQSQIDALTAKTQGQDLTIASLISRIEALENA